jgi:hypothetical protein
MHQGAGEARACWTKKIPPDVQTLVRHEIQVLKQKQRVVPQLRRTRNQGV